MVHESIYKVGLGLPSWDSQRGPGVVWDGMDLDVGDNLIAERSGIPPCCPAILSAHPTTWGDVSHSRVARIHPLTGT